jgi:hypothetical protein
MRTRWTIGPARALAGSGLKIPMSAFSVAFIGNVWALTMFGIGLHSRKTSSARRSGS